MRIRITPDEPDIIIEIPDDEWQEAVEYLETDDFGIVCEFILDSASALVPLGPAAWAETDAAPTVEWNE